MIEKGGIRVLRENGCHSALAKPDDSDLRTADSVFAAMLASSPPAPARPEPLTARELELIDGMIEVQLQHAAHCDRIANRTMAEKQKGWDMERVALLRKLKAAPSAQAQSEVAEPVASVVRDDATVRLEWASVKAAHNAKPGPLYATPPQPSPVADEREAFEAWVFNREVRHPTTWDKECAPDAPPKHKAGHYFLMFDQQQWEAWQARAALASQPTAQVEPLTDEQIDAVFAANHNTKESPWVNWRRFARAIVAHHIGRKA